jgi:hypothetical protein
MTVIVPEVMCVVQIIRAGHACPTLTVMSAVMCVILVQTRARSVSLTVNVPEVMCVAQIIRAGHVLPTPTVMAVMCAIP